MMITFLLIRIKDFTNELSVVKGLLCMPLLSPLKIELIDVIVDLVKKSLQSSIFIASGLYKIKKEETEIIENGLSLEDFCKRHALHATEESVSAFSHAVPVRKKNRSCTLFKVIIYE